MAPEGAAGGACQWLPTTHGRCAGRGGSGRARCRWRRSVESTSPAAEVPVQKIFLSPIVCKNGACLGSKEKRENSGRKSGFLAESGKISAGFLPEIALFCRGGFLHFFFLEISRTLPKSGPLEKWGFLKNVAPLLHGSGNGWHVVVGRPTAHLLPTLKVPQVAEWRHTFHIFGKFFDVRPLNPLRKKSEKKLAEIPQKFW